jgi:hypothetical protein
MGDPGHNLQPASGTDRRAIFHLLENFLADFFREIPATDQTALPSISTKI